MTATITDLDSDRRHFAEFLATRVLHFVRHRYAVWPFEGEDTKDNYFWARTDGNSKYRALDQQAILRHLTGARLGRARYSGIGIPALADAGLAGWGIIDIDTHTTGAVLDVAAIAAVCDPAALVMYSSSGRGIHIYFFPSVPINSYVLRLALDRYVVYLLGTGTIPTNVKIDIFPKGHGTQSGEPAERITSGGSVRFPFAAKRRPTFATYPPTWGPPNDRPGEIFWGTGWIVGFPEKQRLIALAQAEHLSWLATWGGPPCLGRLLAEGADEGERNVLIYDAAYFAAFATLDDMATTQWVQERVLPKLRGTELEPRSTTKTIQSGIERALDPTKPQYVCTTSLCDKNEARCLRLGQPTASGYTTGATASAAAAAEQGQTLAAAVISDGGPNALSHRDGKLYIGDTAVTVEFCRIDDRYCVWIGPYSQWFAPSTILNYTTLPILSSMLQRDVLIPKGAQRGWLTRLLQIIRLVATTFHHPIYSQLKSALYQITQTVGEAVMAVAVYEAMQPYRSLPVDAAMRHYPGADWQPVISPENEVLGMRLVRPDHDFLTVAPPIAPVPPTDPTDY